MGFEIKETVGLPDVVAPVNDNCWYCKEKQEQPDKENVLDEDPDSLADPGENHLTSNSTKLGTALTHEPKWAIEKPRTDLRTEVVPAAHHLVPFKGSLRQVPQLLKYMCKSDGIVRSDVGYDVNDRRNGVWLPGWYAVREENPEFGMNWGAYEHQDEYAIAAMTEAGAQFHDAHGKYNKKVEGTLQGIANKIQVAKPEKCPVCGQSVKDKARPPYGLVNRLHFLARILRKFVTGPPEHWPIQTGYFTSRRSMLMAKKT